MIDPGHLLSGHGMLSAKQWDLSAASSELLVTDCEGFSNSTSKSSKTIGTMYKYYAIGVLACTVVIEADEGCLNNASH